jgi:hypothetical protein
MVSMCRGQWSEAEARRILAPTGATSLVLKGNPEPQLAG